MKSLTNTPTLAFQNAKTSNDNQSGKFQMNKIFYFTEALSTDICNYPVFCGKIIYESMTDSH